MFHLSLLDLMNIQRPRLGHAMYFCSHPSDTSVCMKEIVKHRLSYKVIITIFLLFIIFSSVIFLVLSGLLTKGGMGE